MSYDDSKLPPRRQTAGNQNRTFEVYNRLDDRIEKIEASCRLHAEQILAARLGYQLVIRDGLYRNRVTFASHVKKGTPQ